MSKKVFGLIIIASLAFAAACGSAASKPATTDDTTAKEESSDAKKTEATPTDAGDDTPEKAIADFVKAYEAKDVEGLKKRFAKSTLAGMEKSAKERGKSLDDELKSFVEVAGLPFKGTPEMRNEKIDGDKATIEVNAEGKWEPTPLVKEDGMWKLDFSQMKR